MGEENIAEVITAPYPQPGPQLDAFLATFATELFYGGAMGGGKTAFLLLDFLQDVNTYKEAWQGILFRKTYPDLESVIRQAKKFFKHTKHEWTNEGRDCTFEGGATLRFRYLDRPDDWENYQGGEFTWIGWDELAQHATPNGYMAMKTRLRSATSVQTKRIRSTGNPGGAGHGWVKKRFIDPAPLGYKILKDEFGEIKLFIPSKVYDNTILLKSDPSYINKLKGLGSPELVRAWLEGDWNVVLGAYFNEFDINKHVINPVELPKHWTRFIALDWGSFRPFCALWIAISDGLLVGNKYLSKGSPIIYKELYGSTGEPNIGVKWTVEQLAKKIIEVTRDDDIAYTVVDPACYQVDGGISIAERLARSGLRNIRPADNKRLPGWELIRKYLLGQDDNPQLHIFENCTNLIRTLPLMQHDESRPEDLDSDLEDHCLDSLRYGLMSRPYISRTPAEPIDIHKVRAPTLNELWDTR